jgi:hypothetical protein
MQLDTIDEMILKNTGFAKLCTKLKELEKLIDQLST